MDKLGRNLGDTEPGWNSHKKIKNILKLGLSTWRVSRFPCGISNTHYWKVNLTHFLCFFFNSNTGDPLNRIKEVLLSVYRWISPFSFKPRGHRGGYKCQAAPKIGPLPFSEGGSRGLWGSECWQDLWAALNLFSQIQLTFQEELGSSFIFLPRSHIHNTSLGICVI